MAPPTESTPLKRPKAEQGPPRQNNGPERRLHWAAATAILSTFSCSSSNAMYPYAFAHHGLLLGPLIELSLQGLMCAMTVVSVRVALKVDAETFGELCYALGGHPLRTLGRMTQSANNLLFMPVAIVLISDALRSLVLALLQCSHVGTLDAGTQAACQFWDCNGHALLIVVACAWPVILLARDVGDLTWLATVSTFAILVQGTMLMAEATAYRVAPGATEVVAQSLPPFRFEAAALFGAGKGDPKAAAWYEIFAALGVYLYSYCPMFVAVEVMARMAEPELMPRVVVVSFFFALSSYIPVGLVGAQFLGVYVPNPVTNLSVGYLGAIANAILLYSTFLDFAIVSAVVNREFQQAWWPAFDRLCTPRNLPTWLLMTLPSFAFTVLLVFVTPRLESLVGLLISICVPVNMLIAVPLALLLRHLGMGPQQTTTDDVAVPKQAESTAAAAAAAEEGAAAAAAAAAAPGGLRVAEDEAIRPIIQGWEPLLAISVVVGIGLGLPSFLQTIYYVAFLTDFTGTHYFCEVIG